MSLLEYIPTSDEVNRCIKNEAEGAHEAVLLAVHQPSPLSYRAISGSQTVATNEEELLDFVLTRNVPSGALVVPITGASGVGKSHLIRIVDARLRSSPEARKHLIIRIPKSASLRRVVELILEPLPDPTYAAVKSAFKTALSAIDIETAAIRFHAELEIALKERAATLGAAASANPTQVLREQLDHARRLPQLLSDPTTNQHFRQAVFPRIIHRAVAGSRLEEIDATEGQFAVSDLKLPDSVDLGQATQATRNYYRMALQAREGRGREVAAAVLNDVVDQATRQLFNLHNALGGMTLEEVILEIRRLMLEEKRDLILLVEDFAALTGIQDTLAKVLIQEGVRDGVTQYATMRSVIAVTDGYLVGRDTLATRAMREWIVESKIHSEEEVLIRTRALVASYLNAARWGEEELIRRYSRLSKAVAKDGEWLPVFTAAVNSETDKLIAAFGSERDIPLFPFTDSAIEYLARTSLTRADGLIFNPRFIINDVLRKVLLPSGTTIAENRFPPPGIDSSRPTADVAQWLATLHVSEDVRQRYQRTVTIWGNNPQRRADIGRIPKEIFGAFSLQAPNIEPIVEPTARPTAPAPVVPIPGAGAPPPELDRLRAALENWVQGTLLPAQIANAIRTKLVAALNEQIDWNAERCLKTPIEPNQISVPHAGGEGSIKSGHVRIAPDHTDPNGRLRAELMALLRTRQVYAGRNDYPEFEEDLGQISNLVDRLMPQAIRLVRANNIQQCQYALLAISTNCNALGLALRGRTAKAINAFLFGELNAPEVLPDDASALFRDWKELQAEIWGLRPRLTAILQATAGCFQGAGDTPNGIDIVRLVEHFPDPEMKLELAGVDRISPEERAKLAAMSAHRVATRLGAVAREIRRLCSSITAKLGKAFEKNALVDSAVALADEMGRGNWDTTAVGATLPEFRRLCDEFRATAIKESLDAGIATESKAESDEEAITIARITSLNIRPLLIADDFLRITAAVVNSAIRHATTLEAQYSGVDPTAKAKAILQLFEDLRTQTERLGRGARDAVA